MVPTMVAMKPIVKGSLWRKPRHTEIIKRFKEFTLSFKA